MAATLNPLAQHGSSSPSPRVSRETLVIAGLKVDVYGLAELAHTNSACKVSCLWLHHPRLCAKEDMADIANQALAAYYQAASSGGGDARRGLIAVAFDQRNHGSRLVEPLANEAWRSGNKTHAQDMLGTVTGMVVDTTHLLDAIEGYLFGAGDGPGIMPDGNPRHIDHNLVLGVSLGGHSAWQLMFAEPRVTAGVMVIGCTDYMGLLKDRARLSRLQTYSTQDNGASFLGSKDFPNALVATCKKYDPKGLLFGTNPIVSPISAAEQERLRPLLDSKISGKRFQVLSGGKDKLVPYVASAPFLGFFKDAASTWYKDGGIYVEDNVYPGAGHVFNTEMRDDAVKFILSSIALADGEKNAASSKI